MADLPAPATGRQFVYDAGTPNLAVQVTAAGAKTFYRVGRVGGRPIRLKLGTFPAVTVEAARKRAAEVNGEVASGADPAEARRKLRGEMPVGEAFDLFLKAPVRHRRTKTTKPKRPATVRAYQQQYATHLKQWATRKLSAVTENDVKRLHARIADKAPTMANRVLSCLAGVYSHARAELGYAGSDPTANVARRSESQRSRHLWGPELERFIDSYRLEADPWPDLFSLALMTGARRANLCAARWADLDLERGRWTLPGERMKNGDPIVLHLARPALAMLHRRRIEAEPGSEWVFPARTRDGHLTEVKAALKRVNDRAGITDFRFHDIRHTTASLLVAAGYGLPVAGRMLAHRSAVSTARYAHLATEDVAAAAESHAERFALPELPSAEGE